MAVKLSDVISPELSKLIREAASSSASFNKNTERMIIADSKGRTYTQKPAMGFFPSFKYFIINTTAAIEYTGEVCTIAHDGGIATVSVTYKIKCLPGDAAALGLQAYHAVNLRDIPNGVIREEVEAADGKASLADGFYKEKGKIESVVVKRLKAFGLTVMSISLSVEGDRALLKSQHIEISMFKAGFSGIVPKVSVTLDAVVDVIAGQEVKALTKKLSGETAEREFIRIAREYILAKSDPDDLYKNANTTVRDALTAAINTYLADYGKILASLSVRVHKPGSLDPIVLASKDYINVRIKDSHQLLQIKYKLELLVDPDHRSRAYLFMADTAEIEEVILDQVKNTFANDVSAEEFADALNTAVSAKLARAINLRVGSWGRVAGYLQLEANESRTPKSHIEVEQTIECITKDGFPITVVDTLLLQRNHGSGKVFEVSQIPDMQEWGKNELLRITKNFIINKFYNELRYEFKDTELRQEIQAEAEKLGYKVNQLVTIPKFKDTQDPSKFDIRYKDYNLNSKADGVPLAIAINIDGKITDFSKVIKLIAPEESIADSMQKLIDNKIHQFFNGIDPERFYIRFHFQDPDKGDKGVLEDEIKELITKALSDEYGAKVRNITVNQLNTRLIIRFKQLQEGTFTCEFQDRSGALKYSSKIEVVGVHPEKWRVFNAKGYKPRSEDPQDIERRDIAAHITDFIEDGINNVLLPELERGKITSNQAFVDRLKKLQGLAAVQIENLFGLKIRIYAPLRFEHSKKPNELLLSTNSAKAVLAIQTSQQIHALSMGEKVTRLQELYKKRREKEAEGYLVGALEMKAILAEIKELEADVAAAPPAVALPDPFAKLLGGGGGGANRINISTRDDTPEGGD